MKKSLGAVRGDRERRKVEETRVFEKSRGSAVVQCVRKYLRGLGLVGGWETGERVFSSGSKPAVCCAHREENSCGVFVVFLYAEFLHLTVFCTLTRKYVCVCAEFNTESVRGTKRRRRRRRRKFLETRIAHERMAARLWNFKRAKEFQTLLRSYGTYANIYL